VDGGGS
jgi:hypothetical protein